VTDPTKKENEFVKGLRVALASLGVFFVIAIALTMIAEAPKEVQDELAAGALVGGVVMAVFILCRYSWRFLSRKYESDWKPKIQKTASGAAGASKNIVGKVASKSANVARLVTSKDDAGQRYDNLFKLKKLLDEGIISTEEYELERQKLISQS